MTMKEATSRIEQLVGEEVVLLEKLIKVKKKQAEIAFAIGVAIDDEDLKKQWTNSSEVYEKSLEFHSRGLKWAKKDLKYKSKNNKGVVIV